MPSVSITWHTQHDDNVCPICKAIDGYTWNFENEVPDSLIHPTYGEIWNITTGSLAHEHQLHKGSKYGLISNCRCHTESKVDARDLLYMLQKKIDEIKGAVETDDTKSGSSRRTSFEDIGIDPSKYGLE
jgi:hypothetical protein